MNCSSTHLTSDPTRVMLLTWQQPDSTATALNKFCSICTPNGVYTEFGIDPVRKIIYTTNIIEGLNRQFRQITKNKPSFTNDDSLRRMLYLASQRITKRWRTRCQNWDLVLSQLEIMFSGRAAS